MFDGERQRDEDMNSDEWRDRLRGGCVDMRGEAEVIRGLLE